MLLNYTEFSLWKLVLTPKASHGHGAKDKEVFLAHHYTHNFHTILAIETSSRGRFCLLCNTYNFTVKSNLHTTLLAVTCLILLL